MKSAIVAVDNTGHPVTVVEAVAPWKTGDIVPTSIQADGRVVMVTTNYLGTGDI